MILQSCFFHRQESFSRISAWGIFFRREALIDYENLAERHISSSDLYFIQMWMAFTYDRINYRVHEAEILDYFVSWGEDLFVSLSIKKGRPEGMRVLWASLLAGLNVFLWKTSKIVSFELRIEGKPILYFFMQYILKLINAHFISLNCSLGFACVIFSAQALPMNYRHPNRAGFCWNRAVVYWSCLFYMRHNFLCSFPSWKFRIRMARLFNFSKPTVDGS